MTLAGIDVSNNNGPVDWAQWRGKVSFAGIKISEGLTFADPDARANITGARAEGLTVIGYHFLHASLSGAEQAEWFLSHAKDSGLKPGDLIAVDVEQGGLDVRSPAQLWGMAASFATELRLHFPGYWPLVYTDMSLAPIATASVANCPLWLANPSGIPVTAIGPWKVVSFEQTGQRGVDQDVFYGDAAQLAKLAVP